MIVARSVSEARAALRTLPRPLGLVPTMGALHEGHLSLVATARVRCASVAATLFVNPTQFGPAEDFERYPRDEDADLRLFEEAGADLVFTPAAGEMYPEGFATLVHVGGPLTETLEGASRASHFDGVAVIVAKLLGVAGPDVLFLGQKDAQQLAVVRRMVRDLDLPVEVASVPTVREPDGLAMSSRNAYLEPGERELAAALYRALEAGRAAAGPGAPAGAAVTAALAVLETATRRPSPGVRRPATPAPAGAGAEPASLFAPEPPSLDVDYVAVVDADTFAPEQTVGPRSLLVAAVRVGSVRLIDNLSLAAP